MVKPYIEHVLSSGDRLRVFLENVSDEHLVWHQDEYKRTIIVIEGNGWELQRDNAEPMELLEGHSYTVDSLEYHRLIKGDGDLIIRIKEYK